MKYLISILTFVLLLSSASFAVDFKVGGVYTAWAQSQHQFTLTKDKYDDDYVVQMLRFKVQAIVNENLKIVTRSKEIDRRVVIVKNEPGKASITAPPHTQCTPECPYAD